MEWRQQWCCGHEWWGERSSACRLSPLLFQPVGPNIEVSLRQQLLPNSPNDTPFEKWLSTSDIFIIGSHFFPPLPCFCSLLLPPYFSLPLKRTSHKWCRPVFNLEICCVGGLQDSNFPLRDCRALAAFEETRCCDVSASGGPVTGPLRLHALLQSAAHSKLYWRLNLWEWAESSAVPGSRSWAPTAAADRRKTFHSTKSSLSISALQWFPLYCVVLLDFLLSS